MNRLCDTRGCVAVVVDGDWTEIVVDGRVYRLLLCPHHAAEQADRWADRRAAV